MIRMILRMMCKRRAEKGDSMVDICSDTLGEATENGMGKVRQRCSTVWIIGRLVKRCLKAFNRVV